MPLVMGKRRPFWEQKLEQSQSPSSIGGDVALPAEKKPAPSIDPTSDRKTIDDAVAAASKEFDVSPELVHAVIKQESKYNPKAVSKAGAQGLMQMMPATAKEMGVTDSFDPVKNIRGGVAYLKKLLKQFKGDESLALAAYNAGAGNVRKAGGKVPNIPETKDYVNRITTDVAKSRATQQKPLADIGEVQLPVKGPERPKMQADVSSLPDYGPPEPPAKKPAPTPQITDAGLAPLPRRPLMMGANRPTSVAPSGNMGDVEDVPTSVRGHAPSEFTRPLTHAHVYKFKKKSNGQTYEMDWPDETRPPTKLELDQYAWEQDQRPFYKKAFDVVNKPIVDIRKNNPVMRDAMASYEQEHPYIGGAGNFAVDMTSSMSSPLSLGLMGAEGAAVAAQVAKAPRLARALKTPGQAAAGGMVAHGGYRAYDEKTAAGKAGGLVEAGLGALGLRGIHDLPEQPSPKGLPDFPSEPPAGPGPGRTLPTELPGQLRLGGSRVRGQIPSTLDAPIEGEFTELPERELPAVPTRGALPPAERRFYGGRRGMSTDIGAVEEPLQDARSAASHAFNALIPERFKPYPSKSGVGSHFEPVTPPSETYTGTGRLQDIGPIGETRPPTAAVTADRPYARLSDDDVALFVEGGDKAAIAEAKQRPGLVERLKKLLKNEKGAVGDQSGPQTSEELAASLAEKEVRQPNDLAGGEQAQGSILDGIKSFMKDENGFIKLPGGRAANPYAQRFADWVNNIRASKVEGMLKRREFKDLDGAGFEAITNFQAGDRSGRLADVAKYFDDKLAQLNKAGVNVNRREDYLPQLWADDPKVVKEVYRRLGLKPSFSRERIFEDYVTGMTKGGLTPRFKTIGDLAGWYEQKANKAIADRQFYNMGREQGWIQPQGKGGEDWKHLDPDHFPAAYTTTKDGTVRQVLMTAPPEMHKLITNYLGEPEKIMQWMADKASMSKNLALSSGVPGTALNAHGFNILARTIIGNPKAALTAGKYILRPSLAGKAFDEALTTAPWAVKRGLSLTTEGHEMGVSGSTNLAGRGMQKFLGLQGKLFEDPLFQKVIPALKLKHFNDVVDDLVKGGMARDAAGTEAARYVNDIYGGINWEALGRSRNMQNLARMTILAPDWAESNLNMGKGLAKAFLDPKTPQGRQYVKVARNLIGAYVAADIVNHQMNGHHMWENSPGHALDIQAGRASDGKTRWIRPFGTAADFVRLPMDAISGLINDNPDLGTPSDIAKNRLSIPGRVILDVTTKRDRSNRPFMGKDDYGNPIPLKRQVGGLATELGSLVTPPYVKSVIDYSTGASGAEEATMGTGELPVRYTKTPKYRKPGRRR